MNNLKIVYTNFNGVAIVLHPNLDCGLSLKQIADKDVPNGIAYKFIEKNNVPEDTTFINAWVIDEIKIPDGFGQDFGVGSNKEVIGVNLDGSFILRDKNDTN